MAETFIAEEPKRVPGRYVVFFVIFFAFLVAMFATWGLRVMRKLPGSLQDGAGHKKIAPPLTSGN